MLPLLTLAPLLLAGVLAASAEDVKADPTTRKGPRILPVIIILLKLAALVPVFFGFLAAFTSDGDSPGLLLWFVAAGGIAGLLLFAVAECVRMLAELNANSRRILDRLESPERD